MREKTGKIPTFLKMYLVWFDYKHGAGEGKWGALQMERLEGEHEGQNKNFYCPDWVAQLVRVQGRWFDPQSGHTRINQ